MTLIELETRLFEKLLDSYNRDVKPLTDGPIEVDMGIYPSTLELVSIPFYLSACPLLFTSYKVKLNTIA